MSLIIEVEAQHSIRPIVARRKGDARLRRLERARDGRKLDVGSGITPNG